MSRIGKLPIKIPETVTVEVQGNEVVVKGPKGALKISLHNEAKVEINGGEMKIKVDDVNFGNIHGLTRTLISNMVVGVTDGWSKVLELSGTGYRATTNGSELQLALGFSHPVVIKPLTGISFEVKENKITVKGADKVLVGEVAARIRGLKPADPYKAKGFKYENEVIKRKAGKAAKVGA
ncbi:50S ribosomal protein L6 [Candidatus Amesbacteria bacterium RIFOXYB1_FULL_44_23]|uniref:50S ribosomal protein L6 n=1 Tax=Candidatus Amesbacteria bacterium RIFOXYB1_FULL_44_23 TaxID=1797263 RepID=A0A1F4ZS99_9BACT|nr:MAG: 50S ribosomal protein L6 [Candidatus Amesbacteria bacterium RIFOXYB1_FULL_44_23]